MYTFLFLLLICTSAIATQNCTRHDDAESDGRRCRKSCVNNGDCNGKKKKCLCDGICGMSCFNNESECKEPERVQNGTVRWSHIRWNGIASYACDNGFYLIGAQNRTCRSDRQWSGDAPTCERGCTQSSDGGHSHAVNESRGFRVGESYEFVCDPGYNMRGSKNSRTCGEDFEWSEANYTCVLPKCDTLPTVEHGTVTFTNGRYVGSIATLSCDEGYYVRGRNRSKTCGNDLKWSAAGYICVLQQCHELPPVEHGSVRYSERTYVGSTATVSCDLGYEPTSSRFMKCSAGERGSADGNWIGALPRCRRSYCPRRHDAERDGRRCRKPCVSDDECISSRKCLCDGDCGKSCFNDERECNEPEGIANGQVRRNHLRWGGTALYSCDDGYHLNGRRSRTCHADKKWTGHPPTCQRGCTRPSNEDHSFPKDGVTEFRAGQSYEFTCSSGYYMRRRQFSRRTCGEDLQWSQAEYTCELQQCDVLAPVDHGSILYTKGTNFGSRASVKCETGYQHTASHSINCFPGERGSPYGEWTRNGNLPACTAIPCNEPKAPDHGTVNSYSAWEYGKRISYECNVGYKMKGSSFGVCNEHGNWGSLPICVVDPDCTFSDFRSPTCGYENIEQSWSRMLNDEPGGLQGFVLKATSWTSTLVSMELPEDWSEEFICIKFHFKLAQSDQNWAQLKIESITGYVYWQNFGSEKPETWLNSVIDIELHEPLQYRFIGMTGVILDDVQVLPQKCVDYCEPNPCQNGATCVRRITTYACFCTKYYKGDDCQTDRRCDIPPSDIMNGRRVGGYGDRLPGQNIEYKCNADHKFSFFRTITRYITITCQEISNRGRWDRDPDLLTCEEITCNPPRVGEFQVTETNQRESGIWRVGDNVTYKCVQNYVFRDSSTATKTRRCKTDGQWSITRPECMRARCTYDARGENSPKAINSFYYVGDDANFYCDPGYALTGPRFITCVGHQRWNDTIPRCDPIKCDKPPNVVSARWNSKWKNAQYKDQWDYVGCTVASNSYMDGDRRITCQADGTWTRVPICKPKKSCDPLEAPLHGHIERTDRNLFFSCRGLYELHGRRELNCRNNGTWSGDAPTCEEMKPTTSMAYEELQYLVFAEEDLLAAFNVAQELCSGIGGNLAILYNAEVTRRLNEKLELIPRIRRHDVYLGIKRQHSPLHSFRDSFNWITHNIPTKLPDGWNRHKYRDWYSYYPWTAPGYCGAIHRFPYKWNPQERRWVSGYRYKWWNVNCKGKRYFVCQRNNSPCRLNPCHNEGECEIGNGRFVCHCLKGYKGETCGEEAFCESPDTPLHARWNETRIPYGDSVELICDPGFRYYGSSVSLRCRSNGSWDGNIDGFCGDPSACESSPCQNGGTCRVTKSGYLCQCADGISGRDCERGNPCYKPSKSEIPDQAYIDDKRTTYPLGAQVFLKCLGSRTLDGGEHTLTCLANRTWTQTQASCKGNTCYLSEYLIPPKIGIAGLRGSKLYNVNDTVIIGCREGGSPTINTVERTLSTCELGGKFRPNLDDFTCSNDNNET